MSWSCSLALVWQLEKACGTKATEIEGEHKGKSARSKRTRTNEQERHRRRETESERESICERALARMWARESFLRCRQQISAATRWHWQGRGSHWAQCAKQFPTPFRIYFLSCQVGGCVCVQWECVCVVVCIDINECICTCQYLCIFMCIHGHIYIYTCACIYTRDYKCAYTETRARTTLSHTHQYKSTRTPL